MHSDEARDRAMYEARLSEVEADYNLGRIDDLAREAAIAEEGRRYLRLGDNPPTPAQVSHSRLSLLVLWITMLAVPALSVAIYHSIGNADLRIAETQIKIG